MGFAINTNNDALSTYRNLTNVQNSLSKSLEKLSSGLRINQAGDDAAGLTIATQLGSQISGLTQASRNAQDGTSVVQTADGALGQAQTLLGRLRDLAVQAGNDSNSANARAAITTEAGTISAELARLGSSVNFNGTRLLDGSQSNLTFQIGADSNAQSQISVDLSSANLTAVSTALTTAGVTAKTYTLANLTTASGTDLVFQTGAATQVTLAGPNAFSPATVAGAITALNSNSAFAAKFTASLGADNNIQIVTDDGGALSVSTAVTTSGARTLTPVSAANTYSNSGVIRFDTAANAQLAITAIDTQLSTISTARANIGALENRFASAVSTISTSIQNLTAAKSRITDVDMAAEMVNYTRANVLSQSGTAMLAQANSLPQLALKLLQSL